MPLGPFDLDPNAVIALVGILLLVVSLAVVPAILWAVSGWRTRTHGSLRWWAVLAGLILVSIPGYLLAHPDYNLDDAGEYARGGTIWVSIFAGPWLLAWSIRGKKIVASSEASWPQKGIIYTDSEIADFKRRGLM